MRNTDTRTHLLTAANGLLWRSYGGSVIYQSNISGDSFNARIDLSEYGITLPKLILSSKLYNIPFNDIKINTKASELGFFGKLNITLLKIFSPEDIVSAIRAHKILAICDRHNRETKDRVYILLEFSTGRYIGELTY